MQGSFHGVYAYFISFACVHGTVESLAFIVFKAVQRVKNNL